jgi:hypothetical protein
MKAVDQAGKADLSLHSGWVAACIAAHVGGPILWVVSGAWGGTVAWIFVGWTCGVCSAALAYLEGSGAGQPIALKRMWLLQAATAAIVPGLALLAILALGVGMSR